MDNLSQSGNYTLSSDPYKKKKRQRRYLKMINALQSFPQPLTPQLLLSVFHNRGRGNV